MNVFSTVSFVAVLLGVAVVVRAALRTAFLSRLERQTCITAALGLFLDSKYLGLASRIPDLLIGGAGGALLALAAWQILRTPDADLVLVEDQR